MSNFHVFPIDLVKTFTKYALTSAWDYVFGDLVIFDTTSNNENATAGEAVGMLKEVGDTVTGIIPGLSAVLQKCANRHFGDSPFRPLACFVVTSADGFVKNLNAAREYSRSDDPELRGRGAIKRGLAVLQGFGLAGGFAKAATGLSSTGSAGSTFMPLTNGNSFALAGVNVGTNAFVDVAAGVAEAGGSLSLSSGQTCGTGDVGSRVGSGKVETVGNVKDVLAGNALPENAVPIVADSETIGLGAGYLNGKFGDFFTSGGKIYFRPAGVRSVTQVTNEIASSYGFTVKVGQPAGKVNLNLRTLDGAMGRLVSAEHPVVIVRFKGVVIEGEQMTWLRGLDGKSLEGRFSDFVPVRKFGVSQVEGVGVITRDANNVPNFFHRVGGDNWKLSESHVHGLRNGECIHFIPERTIFSHGELEFFYPE